MLMNMMINSLINNNRIKIFFCSIPISLSHFLHMWTMNRITDGQRFAKYWHIFGHLCIYWNVYSKKTLICLFCSWFTKIVLNLWLLLKFNGFIPLCHLILDKQLISFIFNAFILFWFSMNYWMRQYSLKSNGFIFWFRNSFCFIQVLGYSMKNRNIKRCYVKTVYYFIWTAKYSRNETIGYLNTSKSHQLLVFWGLTMRLTSSDCHCTHNKTLFRQLWTILYFFS